ncbi:hypothetical protein GCM10010442_63610 [Kitasatospora kifunensis]
MQPPADSWGVGRREAGFREVTAGGKCLVRPEERAWQQIDSAGAGCRLAHTTQAGSHAAEVYRPPLREIRLSLHGDDAREPGPPLSSAYRMARLKWSNSEI